MAKERAHQVSNFLRAVSDVFNAIKKLREASANAF